MIKTKQEILSQGYKEDWSTKCPHCQSYDCHKYTDRTVCFSCKRKWVEGVE